MIGKRHKKNDDGAKVLDVDASMQGSLSFKDPVNLHINGRFDGTLSTKGNLVIGEHALVNADITGESILVAGRVNGNITALKELRLIAPACVVGDIVTPLFSITEGAILEGNCKMLAKSKVEETHRTGMMTPEELARYLEVEVGIISEWANSGKIPVMKEGDDWRFDRNSIDEWVAEGKIK